VSNRIDALQQRKQAIGLSNRGLSQLAGVDEDTVYRTFKRHTRPLNDTLDKMEAALAAEEARLADHLAKRDGEGEAA
jgi:hypothetical protein